jgi:hypothetical protein
MKRLALFIVAMAAMMSAVPASAASLAYAITGTNGFSASFTLDDATGPSPYFPGDFYVFDVPGSFSDGSTLAGLTFYDSAQGGGLTILTSGFTEASFTGLTLFSGTLTVPTLIAFGPTSFLDFYDPTISYTASATALIAAPAPEPATWMMLVFGFGAIGVAARRKRSVSFAN